jgi:hypothetical protein
MLFLPVLGDLAGAKDGEFDGHPLGEVRASK